LEKLSLKQDFLKVSFLKVNIYCRWNKQRRWIIFHNSFKNTTWRRRRNIFKENVVDGGGRKGRREKK
jgi:hypothetical protein